MTQYDDPGTVRWFGESWGAPVCDARIHIPTPVGWPCYHCKQKINDQDQGLTVPHISSRQDVEPPAQAFRQEPEGWYVRPFHRFCYMAMLGLVWD